ncbi:MAG: DUF4105 domain-containing protein [Pseudomonadota bacterium]
MDAPSGRARRWPRVLAAAVLSLAVSLSAAWAVLALHYQLPAGPLWRDAAGAAWVGMALLVTIGLWRRRPLWHAALPYGVALALLSVWWAGIAPSAQRQWAADGARILTSRVEGGKVTLDNVRNFDWHSDTDFVQRWESRQVDLDHLRSVDVALSYWMGPAIAHTLVTFGFDDGRFLTFSIEIRKEQGERFSAVGGFFKQYETSLIAAEERDILRVRTNVRGEDVYLYRVLMPAPQMRSLFLAYLDESAQLARDPRFYNTLTANCTTIVFEMARRIVRGLPLDYRLLASGYLDRYLFDVGALMPGYRLEQLHTAGRITQRAQAADGASEIAFSQAIRRGMPTHPPAP